MTIEEFYDTHNGLVYKVARSIATSAPGIDVDDIAQEIWLDLMTDAKWSKIAGNDQGYIKRVMWRAGSKYAERERLTYIHMSAEWIYTPNQVRELLNAYASDNFWHAAPQKDDGANINAKNVLCSLWDLSNAIAAMSDTDKKAIGDVHVNDNTPPHGSAAHRLYHRAIDKLTNRLNSRMAAKSDTETININDSEVY